MCHDDKTTPLDAHKKNLATDLQNLNEGGRRLGGIQKEVIMGQVSQ